MSNFILIFICLSAGILLRKVKGFPTAAHIPINFWLIYIAVPAVTLRYIPNIHFTAQTLFPLSIAAIIFLTAAAFFKLLGHFLQWEKTTIACLTIVAGLGNTSFIGFPLTEAYFGSEMLPIAILCDQGSFLTLSTLGVFVAMQASNSSKGSSSILKKLFQFPPFLAFCTSLFLIAFPLPVAANLLFEKLGQTLVPLALFSVGLQIDWKNNTYSMSLIYGLTYKLLIAPLLILGIVYLLFDFDITMKTIVLEAAMAPMITAAIVASQYNLNQNLSNALVSIGIPISFITTAIWYFMI